MTGVETRSVSRDSLFLLANVSVEQQSAQHRVRVRNLSDGGMMGEGTMKVNRGNRVDVELRNVGSVKGTVAWVQDQRFGIAFDEEIDSQAARAPSNSAGAHGGADANPVSYAHRAPPTPKDSNNLRKI
ncbi:MAG: PilZ domain-containing protein [Erythrobacter sp.]